MSRCAAAIAASLVLAAPIPATAAPAAGATDSQQKDPLNLLVGRLDLGKYKAIIKGLTRFGDRRQGTDRNRAAVDWIEAQLKSAGCTNTERIKYVYDPPPPAPSTQPRPAAQPPPNRVVASG